MINTAARNIITSIPLLPFKNSIINPESKMRYNMKEKTKLKKFAFFNTKSIKIPPILYFLEIT
jgi:hypothetical protein